MAFGKTIRTWFDGRWHDDPAADAVEFNEMGATDCVLDLHSPEQP